MTAKRGVLRILRNRFVGGLIILVPIVLTIKALWWLFAYLDSLARPLTARWFGEEVPAIGFVTTIALILVTGVVFRLPPLRQLLDSLDDVLEGVPLIGTVYTTIKKVLEAFQGAQAREAFKTFVFARLPGRTTPGFLTGSFTLRLEDGTEQTMCTVYVPTNHLYVGDVVVLPPEDVLETDVPVEDGISVILSGGASMPPTVAEKQRRAENAARS